MRRFSKRDAVVEWHVLLVILCLAGQASAYEPIHMAAYRGDLSAIQAELDKGVNINLADPSDGGTPLIMAIMSACSSFYAQHNLRSKVQRSEVETVKFLIKAGADLERKDRQGMTALMSAVYTAKVSPETLQALLDAGADIHAQVPGGSSVLGLASVHGGDADRLKLLLDAGAITDINVAGSKGTTVVMNTAAYGDIARLILVIAAGADVHATDKSGLTALSYAARHGDVSRIDALIKAGVAVNASDNKGRTPLMYAVQDGEPDNISALLRGGADIQQTDKNGLSALVYAASAKDNQLSRVLTLTEHGADLRIKSKNGTPVFHYLLASADRKTIQFVLDKGVAIDSTDGGKTPLMMAAERRRLENVATLLDKGADANIATEEGETALSLAEKRFRTIRFSEKEEILSLLRKHTDQVP